jgi:hypothetical protein
LLIVESALCAVGQRDLNTPPAGADVRSWRS